MKKFINYAHRGASTYFPENTMISFRNGLQMGANGIETDVQLTKDGVVVLFHDDTLDRVTGKTGCIADYTYKELLEFDVKNGDLTAKIPTLEEFLKEFKNKDITFAIELKVKGVAKQTAEIIYKYGVQDKVIITSFIYDALMEIKEVAPDLKRGYLLFNLDEKTRKEIEVLELYEICPKGQNVTKEQVEEYHQKGYSVRAWGISNEQIMIETFDKGVDGMTVNFPDKLTDYLKKLK
jgi:glycerophosphoryl diester phosphodiesterase